MAGAGGHSMCQGSGGSSGEEVEGAVWVDLPVIPSQGTGHTGREAGRIVQGSSTGNIVEGEVLPVRALAVNIGQGLSSGHIASAEWAPQVEQGALVGQGP